MTETEKESSSETTTSSKSIGQGEYPWEYTYRDKGPRPIRVIQGAIVVFGAVVVAIIISVVLSVLTPSPGDNFGFTIPGWEGFQLNYLPLIVWLGLGLLMLVAGLLVNLIAMPWGWAPKTKKPDDFEGDTPFECGEVEVKGTGRIRFGFQYYPFALVYVVFDCVGGLLMLWALMFNPYPEWAWVFLFLLIAFLIPPFVGLIFWTRKGGLAWQ